MGAAGGLRITGGRYKGRRIKVPPGIIRPAMDRMRESLFAILGNLNGVSFLDLYSGSGIVGLEAVSRGAIKVILVESDQKKREVINQNITWVEEAEVTLFMMPVERFVRIYKGDFDLIYSDPPFIKQGELSLLENIEKKGLLKKEGLLILHAPKEAALPETIGSLNLVDKRAYGRSILYFFKSGNSSISE
jgi:16S rRNA (guanine(966)-N(2))-methyltransferase RsmD